MQCISTESMSFSTRSSEVVYLPPNTAPHGHISRCAQTTHLLRLAHAPLTPQPGRTTLHKLSTVEYLTSLVCLWILYFLWIYFIKSCPGLAINTDTGAWTERICKDTNDNTALNSHRDTTSRFVLFCRIPGSDVGACWHHCCFPRHLAPFLIWFYYFNYFGDRSPFTKELTSLLRP